MDSSHVVEHDIHHDELVEPLPFIHNYLRTKSTVFVNLRIVKDQGSKSKGGDAYFEKQCNRADTADLEQQTWYFNMTCTIGAALEQETNALKLEKDNPLVLDTCLAPGGFAKVVLDLNPTAEICAMSLPESVGGHVVLVGHGEDDGRIDVRYVGVSILGIECGLQPKEIQEGMNAETLYKGRRFDLAICDGQLLRRNKSPRDAQVEDTAASRLLYSQLIFVMNRSTNGGNLIVLLHKVEAWNNIQLLATISKFSEPMLFKYHSYHGPRSSFYLVTRNVQSDSALAHAALLRWKRLWRKCVLGATDCSIEDPLPKFVTADDITALLDKFGDEFIKLAEPIWATQMAATQKARWFPKHSKAGSKQSQAQQIHAKSSWRAGGD